jgi:regulator of PEP synthase PpsR (kinase-PPPase family)
MKHTAFFISDSTGITAETLGKALLSQFPKIKFNKITIPYVNSLDKAREAVTQINKTSRKYQTRPLIFSTLANPEIRSILADCNGFVMDFFDILIGPLEEELKSKYAKEIGKLHKMPDLKTYDARIAAIDFALNTDDGIGVKDYKNADVILIGVSRSGKTPTCLYLALKFAISAANYPITEENINIAHLPKELIPYRKKLFGLTITPTRLHDIREQRRPHSNYAKFDQCQKELTTVEQMFAKEKIPYLDSTVFSIEELATKITQIKKIPRHGL